MSGRKWVALLAIAAWVAVYALGAAGGPVTFVVGMVAIGLTSLLVVVW